MSELTGEVRGRAVEVVRELIPADGSWILERLVTEKARERGLSARAALAAMGLLACADIEAEMKSGQLWIRWRAKE